jgi:hypothetical protein
VSIEALLKSGPYMPDRLPNATQGDTEVYRCRLIFRISTLFFLLGWCIEWYRIESTRIHVGLSAGWEGFSLQHGIGGSLLGVAIAGFFFFLTWGTWRLRFVVDNDRVEYHNGFTKPREFGRHGLDVECRGAYVILRPDDGKGPITFPFITFSRSTRLLERLYGFD